MILAPRFTKFEANAASTLINSHVRYTLGNAGEGGKGGRKGKAGVRVVHYSCSSAAAGVKVCGRQLCGNGNNARNMTIKVTIKCMVEKLWGKELLNCYESSMASAYYNMYTGTHNFTEFA